MLSDWQGLQRFLHPATVGCIMRQYEQDFTRRSGGNVMGREFELKYRATGEQLEEIEACYQGFREIRMETT